MQRRTGRWWAGYLVAACCVALGVVRAADGANDWLMWAGFTLAPCYAFAAVVARRQHNVERALRRTPSDPTPWTTQPSRIEAWLSAAKGVARHPDDVDQLARRTAVAAPTILTRDRVGAALAAAAAATGLVLVSTDHDQRGHDVTWNPAPALGHADPTPSG